MICAFLLLSTWSWALALVSGVTKVGVETPIHRFITAVLGPYVSGQAEPRAQNVHV